MDKIILYYMYTRVKTNDDIPCVVTRYFIRLVPQRDRTKISNIVVERYQTRLIIKTRTCEFIGRRVGGGGGWIDYLIIRTG